MNTIIKHAFWEAAKKHGFTKTGDTWHLDCEETVLVAHLQKSQNGDSYYINLGIRVKALGEVKAPKEHQCHIRVRLSRLCGQELEAALDGDNTNVKDDERQRKIIECLTTRGMPFLKACNTIDGIREEFQKQHLSSVLVHKELKEFIQKQ